MKTEFRILRKLVEEIQADLHRPHDVAYERVGFIRCKSELGGELVLAESYEPIEDDKYIADKFVGAKFSGAVIERELKHSLKSNSAIFHVHQHDHLGAPMLSGVDTKSINEICAALANINSKVPHGCILLSEDVVKTYVFSPELNRLVHANTLVIGFPLIFNSFKENKYER